MPRSRSRSFESRMQIADELILTERAALAEQAVHERRLAVVDVRDDGDIAKVFASHEIQCSRNRLGSRQEPKGSRGKNRQRTTSAGQNALAETSHAGPLGQNIAANGSQEGADAMQTDRVGLSNRSKTYADRPAIVVTPILQQPPPVI